MNTLKFLIFFWLSQFSLLHSQENFDLTQDWIQLKVTLIKKTEISLDLVDLVRESKKIDKNVVVKTKNCAKELRNLCENNNLDKSLIALINNENKKLSEYLTNIFTKIEKDIEIISDEQFLRIMDELFSIEKNLYKIILEYNEKCMKSKNNDLIFKIKE